MRRFLINAVGVAVFTPIFNWLLKKLPILLTENAVMGWLDNAIGEHFGWTSPSVATVIAFIWNWGIPAIAAVIAVWLWHLAAKRWASPLPVTATASVNSGKTYRPTENKMPPQFRRWRWWHAIWAGAPFHSYKSRKRLEFIDSWTRFYEERTRKELLIELIPHAAQIETYTPVCAITLQNVTSRELDRCLVEVKEISSHWPNQMPSPLVLRTDGQIRGKRSGRFILSPGQLKPIPILFRGAARPKRPNEWFFFDEHGEKYFIHANPIKIVLAIYGATETKKALIFIDVDAGWNPFPTIEMVATDYKLPHAQQEIAPPDKAPPSAGFTQIATATVSPPAQYSKAQINRILEAIDAFYTPLGEIEQTMVSGTWTAGSLEANVRNQSAAFVLAQMDQMRLSLNDQSDHLDKALRKFSLYTEVCQLLDNKTAQHDAFFVAYNELANVLREIPDKLSASAVTIFVEAKKTAFMERTVSYMLWAGQKKKELASRRESYLRYPTTD